MSGAFDCRMCGHCCQGTGGIVVSAGEQERIRTHLNVPMVQFLQECTIEKSGKTYLTTRPDGFCLFFGDQGCSIHAVKPDVCRAWPFFRGNLLDESSWEMAQDYCPGIRAAAGHDLFVRHGLEYLQKHGLVHEEENGPNALRPPQNRR
ncbi:MAG: YkgJ family cysteine cluster protein [Desulfovibrionales bacterium]